MKNKKITLAFVAMIILVMAIAPIVKASDSNPLNIINEEGTNNTATNNEELNTNTSNEATNNTNNTNNTNGTLTVDNENNIENTNVPENKLPQTGVAEDTTLFIFIAICLVSAIYAYTKIRNYKNV